MTDKSPPSTPATTNRLPVLRLRAAVCGYDKREGEGGGRGGREGEREREREREREAALLLVHALLSFATSSLIVWRVSHCPHSQLMPAQPISTVQFRERSFDSGSGLPSVGGHKNRQSIEKW